MKHGQKKTRDCFTRRAAETVEKVTSGAFKTVQAFDALVM